MEQERKYFKRYKVSVEVQIDRNLDPAKFFEVVFTDSNGTQHSLREVHESRRDSILGDGIPYPPGGPFGARAQVRLVTKPASCTLL